MCAKKSFRILPILSLILLVTNFCGTVVAECRPNNKLSEEEKNRIDGNSNYLNAFYQQDSNLGYELSNILAGSAEGFVYSYYGGTDWRIASPDLGGAVLCLAEYQNAIYAGTRDGKVWKTLSSQGGGYIWTEVMFPSGHKPYQVNALVEYREELYAGTSPANLFRLSDNDQWEFVTTASGFFGIRCLYVHQDILFLGDISEDIFGHYDEDKYVNDGYYGVSCIWDFQEYNNRLYAGSYYGDVYRLQEPLPNSSENFTWERIRSPDGYDTWELETFQDLLYVSHCGDLLTYNGNIFSESNIVIPNDNKIIAMLTCEDGENLLIGVGQEMGAGEGCTGSVGRIYLYDGIELISISEEIGAGIQCFLNTHRIQLTKIDDVDDGDCVGPEDEITYTISYSYPNESNEPNLLDFNDVNIIDYLPSEADFISADSNGIYDPCLNTVTWSIGTLEPNDSGVFTLTIQVNYPEPGRTIINECKIISGEEVLKTAYENTSVCCWYIKEIYADVNATGNNNGTSWANAYNYLQDALTDAQFGCSQIFVAAGTYKPDCNSTDPNGSGDQSATFNLIDKVSIYGGFPSGGGEWEDRDPNLYETILSGDLLGNDIHNLDPCDLNNDPNRSDNSYHVVTGYYVNETAVLDGFTITDGNALCFHTLYPEEFIGGGGMYNYYASPTVTNCKFLENSAVPSSNVAFGGGICNYRSSPTINDCNFSRNWAQGYTDTGYGYSSGGGGICNYYSDPNVINCTFTKNAASGYLIEEGYYEGGLEGGGMFNYNSSPVIIDCNFTENSSYGAWLDGGKGGGIYNEGGNPVINGCTFNGNWVFYQPGSAYSGGGGVYVSEGTNAEFANCIFTENKAFRIEWMDTYGDGGRGGGLFNIGNSIITNCKFVGNSATGGEAELSTAGYGGGIYNGGTDNVAYADIANCLFSGNLAESSYSNAGRGGGIYNDSTYGDVNITNCTFAGNTATDSPSGGSGSELIENPGFENFSTTPWTVLNGCLIGVNYDYPYHGSCYGKAHNRTNSNQGIKQSILGKLVGGHTYKFTAWVSVSSYEMQTVNAYIEQTDGAGTQRIDLSSIEDVLYDWSQLPTNYFTLNVTGTLTALSLCFDGPDAGVELYLDCPENYNNPPVRMLCESLGRPGYGGGVYGAEIIKNSIFWGNIAATGPQIRPTTVVVNYSDVQGGWTGTGNINADPCFVEMGYWGDVNDPNIIVEPDDPNAFWYDGNYRLLSDSPCIDAGDNNSVPEGTVTDLDGFPRFIDGDCNDSNIVDMGAYEFNPSYIGDFDYSCDVDFLDFAIFAQAWLSEPPEPQWNRFCDIGNPPDDYIDLDDLDVFTENWLTTIP